MTEWDRVWSQLDPTVYGNTVRRCWMCYYELVARDPMRCSASDFHYALLEAWACASTPQPFRDQLNAWATERFGSPAAVSTAHRREMGWPITRNEYLIALANQRKKKNVQLELF